MMKIRSLTTSVFPLALKEPYVIAYETISEATNILLTIQTDSGEYYGITGPDEAILGETTQSVLDSVGNIAKPLLLGGDIESKNIRDELFKGLDGQPAATALFDIAFHDYDARKAGLPLYKYLGAKKDRIATAITVFIHPLKKTVEKVLCWKEKGFSYFKIKGGLSVQEDIEKLHAIRHALGSKGVILFDANQGYKYEEAVYFLKETKKLEIAVIEQPTCKNYPHILHDLYETTQAPIMADECICSRQDICDVLDSGYLPYINIKLMKIGRVQCALQAADYAAKRGTEVIMGCMEESALLIAASLHIALAMNNVPFVDLDSFVDYDDDPTVGTVILENGVIRTNEKPGIGFEGLHR